MAELPFSPGFTPVPGGAGPVRPISIHSYVPDGGDAAQERRRCRKGKSQYIVMSLMVAMLLKNAVDAAKQGQQIRKDAK